jgi:hypothetical protein
MVEPTIDLGDSGCAARERGRSAATLEGYTVTLVCCWLDNSYGRHRVTAIADSRAADYRNNAWHPRSDMTVKLFRVPISCHCIDELDPGTGTWRKAYYQTEIAIGFAGYCFEAMTIITLFSRTMEQLVSVVPEARPLPERDRISAILEKIMNDYFAGHGNSQTQRVEFLLFGFSSEQVPWVALIRYVPGGPSVIEFLEEIMQDRVYSIGDGASTSFRRSVQEVLGRIRRHSERLRADENSNECDLEKARHRDAQKKQVEESALEILENEYSRTVGGHIQKLELYPVDGKAIVAFTRESRADILDHLPHAAPGLTYLSIDEVLGRKPRE